MIAMTLAWLGANIAEFSELNGTSLSTQAGLNRMQPKSRTASQQTRELEMKPIKVQVVKNANGWQLMRGGKPYYINGVGGTGRMNDLVREGGNSMRTWGTEKVATELDACYARGLTLMVGIWLGHKSYFDYKNPQQVKEQFERVKSDVLAFKDHPSTLLWGFGNEMEMNNDIPEVWMSIEEMAKFAKKVDPNHPTSTVVADINEAKIRNILTYAPSIDILGINSYGGMKDLPQRLKKAGWNKPYIVTEFGPNGPWEFKKTSWGAVNEQTSTEKAKVYANSYRSAIASQPNWCLGSYAFLWGNKQEETPTWFGMFLPSGERTEAIDVISQMWSGRKPKNSAPRITKFEFDQLEKEVTMGTPITARVVASDPNNDKLKYEWSLWTEARNKQRDGQGEDQPVQVAIGAEYDLGGATLSGNLVKRPGSYRLYVKVTDGKGNAAIANGPFLVK